MPDRPKFGWINPNQYDSEPKEIFEEKRHEYDIFVAVVPLPFDSSEIRKEVREFVERISPQ